MTTPCAPLAPAEDPFADTCAPALTDQQISELLRREPDAFDDYSTVIEAQKAFETERWEHKKRHPRFEARVHSHGVLFAKWALWDTSTGDWYALADHVPSPDKSRVAEKAAELSLMPFVTEAQPVHALRKTADRLRSIVELREWREVELWK